MAEFVKHRKLIGTGKAADRIGCSKPTVVSLAVNGELAHYRIRTRIMFEEAEIERFIQHAHKPTRADLQTNTAAQAA